MFSVRQLSANKTPPEGAALTFIVDWFSQEAFTAFLIILSVGILIAHTMDAFRLWK